MFLNPSKKSYVNTWKKDIIIIFILNLFFVCLFSKRSAEELFLNNFLKKNIYIFFKLYEENLFEKMKPHQYANKLHQFVCFVRCVVKLQRVKRRMKN